jgi:hypothetical protein
MKRSSVRPQATELSLAAVTAVLLAMSAPFGLNSRAQVAPPVQAGNPLSVFTTADFSGSGTCAVCHSGLRDQAGANVSIDAHWRVTMMAQAARDPLWQAKVSSEVARTPALQSVIEDKCATCHMPMARTQAVTDGVPVGILGGGFLDPGHPLAAAAGDGVSCTLCHQVRAQGLGSPESFTGHYAIDTTTAPPARPIFGRYAAPLVNQMQNIVGFTPVEAAHVRDSALCATCHTLYTPTVDASGHVVGTMPEQTPYLEWRHSTYGDGAGEDRSCQECHMPAASGGVVISNRPGGRQIGPRSPFHQHQFLGANTYMLDLLASHVTTLQLAASSDLLAASASRTGAYLTSQTATVAIASASRTGDLVDLAVDVRSLTGHKFPTGFPSRRAWLHVTVTDASGRVLFESGRLQADGRLAGNDADEDAGAVEPHHDLISSSDEVQVYEAVMADTDGRPTYTLLRGARYAKDNRLLPAGFLAATAPPDVAVKGEAAYDPDFDDGRDRVRYAVSVQGASGALAVSVELLYQTASYRFLADLASTPTAQVERFNGLAGSAPGRAELVASTSTVVR